MAPGYIAHAPIERIHVDFTHQPVGTTLVISGVVRIQPCEKPHPSLGIREVWGFAFLTAWNHRRTRRALFICGST